MVQTAAGDCRERLLGLAPHTRACIAFAVIVGMFFVRHPVTWCTVGAPIFLGFVFGCKSWPSSIPNSGGRDQNSATTVRIVTTRKSCSSEFWVALPMLHLLRSKGVGTVHWMRIYKH